jgi:hypothetical protein
MKEEKIMSNQPETGGRCPFSHDGPPKATEAITGGAATSERASCPHQSDALAEAAESRPRGYWQVLSPRVGVSNFEYVVIQMLHDVLQWFNHKLAKPNRMISWLDWPYILALLYLVVKLQFVRLQSISSPHSFMSKFVEPIRRVDRLALKFFNTEGVGNADHYFLKMGGTSDRFAYDYPPYFPGDEKELEAMASRGEKILLRRKHPVTGEDIEILAGNRSRMFAGEILFEVHNFFQVTEDRCPINQNPHKIKRSPGEGFPNDEMILDRSSDDATRATKDGPPTRRANNHQWILTAIYGRNKKEEARVRDGAKLKTAPDGNLLRDPDRPGLPLVAFVNNMTPDSYVYFYLIFNDHNACVDWLTKLHPDWDDETKFQTAKKAMVLLNAEFHTKPWTKDLLRNRVMSSAMDADWNGFIGKRGKMYLIRLFGRHPFLNWLGTPLRHFEPLWGMVGSGHRHFSGDYEVPMHFRIAYRLHWLLRSKVSMFDPKTKALLKRYDLLDYISDNTMEVVQEDSVEGVIFSMVKDACGGPALHNMPSALGNFPNQQNGQPTSLAFADLFREYTDGTWSYLQFLRSLGEREPTSFLELTAGNVEFAKELSELYEDDLNKVHVEVGILAEFKADGNALPMSQFLEFAKDAPRRLKSLWLLTDGFNLKNFGWEAMCWGTFSGGFMGMIDRHAQGLRPHMEGVDRPFSIWPDTQQYPERLYQKVWGLKSELARADVKTFLLGSVTGLAAIFTGAASPSAVRLVLAVYAAGAISLAGKRIMIMKDLEDCWRACYTDLRKHKYGLLADAQAWIDRAAFFGKLGALGVLAGGGYMVWQTWSAKPLVAALFGLLALTGFSTRKTSDELVKQADLLAIALLKRMAAPLHYVGEDAPEVERRITEDDLRGATDLERHYSYLAGDNPHPVATFSSCYYALRTQDRLAPWTALGTAILSVILFGRKTQKGLSLKQKWAVGIGLFDWFKIYIPGLIHAQGKSNTRAFAAVGNEKGITPGDLDMEEINLLWAWNCPGLTKMSEYSAARAREWLRLRDKEEGNGNFLSQWFGQLALARRHSQMFDAYSDTEIEEDGAIVRAVSYEQYLAFYKGIARAQKARNLKEGSTEPRPVAYTELETIVTANEETLDELYANGLATARPVGKSNGRALFVPGTKRGGLLRTITRLFWQGKVFGKDGILVNRILGGHLIKARVSSGNEGDVSWFDGKPAIIIDYWGTSLLAFFIRDEIRELYHEGSEIYLGKAFIRLPFGKRLDVIYFALDFRTE